MHQQSSLQQQSNHVRPVNRPVKRIQFPAVMERVINERNEAENVKMHRSRSGPAFCKNEEPDEEIQNSEHSEAIPDHVRLAEWSGDNFCFKGNSSANQRVRNLRPDACPQ